VIVKAAHVRLCHSRMLSVRAYPMTPYKSVLFRETRVTAIRPAKEGFAFDCADGAGGVTSKVLLATGIMDELPEIAGVEPLYGISVHHCLYCDGFEYAGKPVAALGKGDKGADLAVMMKHWIADVVACSDRTEISADAARKLKQHGIPLRSEPVVALEGPNGVLTKIKFKSGPELKRAGLFFSTGCRQASDLSQRLGCKRDEKGGVVTDPVTEETSVPGVYVAGDVSRDVLLVSIAIAEWCQSGGGYQQGLPAARWALQLNSRCQDFISFSALGSTAADPQR
jgi:thioredoxin reductase